MQAKFSNEMKCIMTTQTLAAAENGKWPLIWVLFFTNFWLRICVRKENAESFRNRLRHSGFVANNASEM